MCILSCCRWPIKGQQYALVCMCVCALVCVLQISKRLCGSGSALMSVLSGVNRYLWWLILIHGETPSNPQLWTLSLWLSAVDMWNKCNASWGRQAALFLSRTVSSLSPSWVVSSVIVQLPLPKLIAPFCSPTYINLLFFFSCSPRFPLSYLPAWLLKDTLAKCQISHYRKKTRKRPTETDGF